MKTNLLLVLSLLVFTVNAQDSCNSALQINTGLRTTGVINGTNTTTGCWATAGMTGTHAEWYAFSPAADGIARINTNLPANDGVILSNNIKLSVYTGTCSQLICYDTAGQIMPGQSYFADISFEVRTGTTYYIAFDDYWSSKGLQFDLSLITPTCNMVLPFTEDFATHLGYTCWKTFNTDENQRWVYYDAANLNIDPATDPVAAAFSAITPGIPKNDWLISSGLNLEANTTYQVSIKYNALDGGFGLANESFRAVMLNGRNPNATGQTVIGSVSNITQQGAYVPPYNMDLATTVTYNFTPQSTGNYYLGIHANTPTTAGVLLIYGVTVTAAPLSAEMFEKEEFLAYPSPVGDNITIQGSGNFVIQSIDIVDVNGRIIVHNVYSASNEAVVETSHLSSGIYFLNIKTEKGISIRKIVKS